MEHADRICGDRVFLDRAGNPGPAFPALRAGGFHAPVSRGNRGGTLSGDAVPRAGQLAAA